MIRPKSVSIKNVLSKAISLEEENVAKCLLWAERFRPYNKDMALLLEELAEEEKLYYKKLVDVYRKRFGEEGLKMSPLDIDQVMDDCSLEDDHFYVIDEIMSRQALLDVIKAEFKSFVFYHQAKLKTTDPVLHEIYTLLADCEEQHVHELRCSLEPKEVYI